MFTEVRRLHAAAWDACLSPPSGLMDTRADDPDWDLLRAAQDEATTSALALQNSATEGGVWLDAWAWRETVATTRRALEQAAKRAVEANLRLCVHVAGQHRRSKLSLQDRVQHATMGCLRAVRGFDPTRGFKFSTYATTWMNESLQRAEQNTADTIRLPVHVHETRRVVWAAQRAAEARGEVLSIADLAARTNRPEEAVRRVLDLPFTVSVDSDPERRSTMERAADLGASHPDDDIDAARYGTALHAAVERLTPQVAGIVRERFGFNGDAPPETLSVIGQRLNLSRERIRQLEAKGVRRLRVLVPAMMRA